MPRGGANKNRLEIVLRNGVAPAIPFLRFAVYPAKTREIFGHSYFMRHRETEQI